jgi:hypothetical protein
MDYSEYMLAAYRHDFREVKMTDGDLDFLSEKLATYREGRFSVYQIYSDMKKEGSSMAYKNVHQKVHKLLSLGLIQDIGTGYVLHGAKYYQISLNRWVNLILKSEDFLFHEAIRQYYDKNIIFNMFIYPYFELETILFFLNHLEVNTYLRNCCQTTIHTMNEWESGGEERNGVLGLPRSKLRRLPTEELLDSIKKKLHHTDNYKATLAGLRKMIKLEKSKGLSGMSFVIHRSIPEILDLQVKSFLFGQIIKGSHIKFLGSALSNDRKFMAAVEGIDKELNNSYNKLVDLGKTDN